MKRPASFLIWLVIVSSYSLLLTSCSKSVSPIVDQSLPQKEIILEVGENILSAAIGSNTLYLLTEDGRINGYSIGDGQLLDLGLLHGNDDLDIGYGDLFVWKDELYYFDGKNKKFGEITSNGITWSDVQYKSTLSDLIEETILQDPMVMDDTLIFLDTSTRNSSIYTISLLNGEIDVHASPDITSISPYKDGCILASEYSPKSPISIYDIKSFHKNRQVSQFGDSNNSTFCYDESNDRIFGVANSRIYLLQADIQIPYAIYLSQESRRIYSGYLAPGYFVDVQKNMVSLVGLHESYGEETPFEIEEELALDELISSFSTKYPNAKLASVQDKPLSEYQQNGWQLPDIFVINSRIDPFDTVFDKGYATDLSSSQILMESVKNMHPQIQEIVLREGKLVAYPMNMRIIALMQDNDALVEFGLNPPETMIDFLTLHAVWENSTEYDKLRNIFWSDGALSPNTQKFNLIGLVFNQYHIQHNKSEFNSPLIKNALDIISAMPLQNMDPEITGTRIEHTGDVVTNNIFLGGDECQGARDLLSTLNDNPGMSLMPYLPFSSEDEKVVPFECDLAIVNPSTTNLDHAIAYLELYAMNMPQEDRLFLYPEYDTPVMSSEINDEIMSIQALIKEKEEALEFADEEYKQEIVELVNQIRSSLDYLERRLWLATPERIDDIHALFQYLVLYPQEDELHFEILQNSKVPLAQGTIAHENELEKLDQRIFMSEGENAK